jgi:DNA polymerase-3 subunit epsilon
MRQIFLDTETTGLSADSGDRVIEIGCVEMVSRRFTDRNFHHYLNPERSSHPDAVKVHGLTDEFLADKPKFAEVAPALLDYVRDAHVVIHNAAFDLGFLDAEFKRLGLPKFSEHVASITDSLLMAREMFPGKANSLDALCRRLEVDNSGRSLHGALLDAGLLAEVYIRLTRGQDSLIAEVAEASGSGPALQEIDLSTFQLPVLTASEADAQEHERVLGEIDKASSGKTLWRSLEPVPQPQAG